MARPAIEEVEAWFVEQWAWDQAQPRVAHQWQPLLGHQWVWPTQGMTDDQAQPLAGTTNSTDGQGAYALVEHGGLSGIHPNVVQYIANAKKEGAAWRHILHGHVCRG